jgi:hypothetical protein
MDKTFVNIPSLLWGFRAWGVWREVMTAILMVPLVGCVRLGYDLSPAAAHDGAVTSDSSTDAATADGLVVSDGATDAVGDEGLDSSDGSTDGGDSGRVWPLAVEPLYPNNGSNWLDYVAKDDPSLDRFHQDDLEGVSTCAAPASETYLNNCVHGGEFRRVVVNGASSCDGLSLTEHLGLFRWRCVQEPGGEVVFYSDGLRAAKGIGHAIDCDARPLSFRPNWVSVEGAGGYMGQSPPSVWWTNTLHDVVGEGLNAGTPNVLNGGGNNDIYVVAEDLRTDGFNLNADRIGLIICPGHVHTYTGRSNADHFAEPTGDRQVAVAVGAQRFVWVEGSTPGEVESDGIRLVSSSMARLNNVVVDAGQPAEVTGGSYGLWISDGSGNHVTGMKSTRGFRCATFATQFLTISGFVGAQCSAGIMVLRGSDIWMDRITMSNTRFYEAMDIRAHRTFLTDALFVNVGEEGLRVHSRPTRVEQVAVTRLTVVNSEESGLAFWGASNVTYNSVLIANGAGAAVDARPIEIQPGNYLPAFDATYVNIASAALDSGVDILVDGTNQVGTPFELRFHGTLVTQGDCRLVGAPDSPGLTAGCRPFGDSTASPLVGLAVGNLFVGALTVQDAVNPSDDWALNPSWEVGVDFVSFENRYRAWSQDLASRVPTHEGPWVTGAGAVWDYSLAAGAEGRVFQRVPAPAAGGRCPGAVAGKEVATDHWGNTFLLNATETFFDYVGDDDGLCESGESCLYSPNIGAYQGHGDTSRAACVFDDAGGVVTGVTMNAYPENGR